MVKQKQLLFHPLDIINTIFVPVLSGIKAVLLAYHDLLILINRNYDTFIMRIYAHQIGNFQYHLQTSTPAHVYSHV